MADLADMLGEQTARSLTGPSQMQQAIQSNTEIALHQEQIQNQRAQIDMQKQNLDMQKIEKIGSMYETAAKLEPGSARNFFVNEAIPKTISALKLDGVFSPASMKVLGAEPNLMPYIRNQIETGHLSYAAALKAAADPSGQELLKLVPDLKSFMSQQELQSNDYSGASAAVNDNAKTLGEADKFRIAKDEATKNAMIAAGSRMTNTQTAKDEQAARATSHVVKDPVLIQQTNNASKVIKGLNILNDPTKPVTMTAINEIAQDFAAALSGASAGSDFKLKEINKETLLGKFREAAAFANSDPNQPAPPKVVEFWLHFGQRLDESYHSAIKARADVISKQAPTVYKNNPAAVQAIQQSAQSFRDGTWSGRPPRYEVGGSLLSRDAAIKFYQAHPQFKPNEQLKQELGF